MAPARKLDFAPSLSAWNCSFWSVYAIFTFCFAALSNSLSGFLGAVLLAAPAYASCLIILLLAWQPALPDTTFGNATIEVLRGTLSVLLRSIALFAPIAMIAYFQLHVIKTIEPQNAAVFAWPKNPPSAVLTAALVAYVPLACCLAARPSVTRAWERLSQAAPASGPTFHRPFLRILACVSLVLAALTGISVLRNDGGWRALAWPATGVLSMADDVARMSLHYDQSRPWRIGARYIFGYDWNLRILDSGMDLNYYNAVELTPIARKDERDNSAAGDKIAEMHRIRSIAIYSNTLFGSVRLEKTPDRGEFFCHPSPYDLIECRLAEASSQERSAMHQGYFANLVGGRRFDRVTQRVMDAETLHRVERQGVYMLGLEAEPDFVAHCEAETCRSFSVYRTNDGDSAIEIEFSRADLEHWRKIAGAVEDLLTRLHDRAKH